MEIWGRVQQEHKDRGYYGDHHGSEPSCAGEVDFSLLTDKVICELTGSIELQVDYIEGLKDDAQVEHQLVGDLEEEDVDC